MSDRIEVAGRPVCTIDFEASCLPCLGSFPIEVAIAHPDGRCRSWLIRPTRRWRSFGLWDPASEALHGIPYEQLLAEGQGIETVVAELEAEIGDCILLTDVVRPFQFWLDLLLLESGVNRYLPVGQINDVLFAMMRARNPDLTTVAANQMLVGASMIAASRYPRENRAGPDAQRLAEILRILAGPAISLVASRSFGRNDCSA